MAITRRRSFMRLLLALLNVWATALTILSLRENFVINAVTGRYHAFTRRLTSGSINTDIVQPEYFRIDDLVTTEDMASYTLITAPRRDPSSFGEYRSVCTNINTHVAPVSANTFVDFWGHGPRRIQIYVHSISVPNCQVMNVLPAWRKTCIANYNGNATACHEYVLANFDTLRKNRRIRMTSSSDFGGRGVPLMRCLGRPLVEFGFKADLLIHQSYWDGGDWHVAILTSTCRGVPLARSSDWEYALFESVNVDEGADNLLAMPPVSWFVYLVSCVHSIVTVVMIGHSTVLALFHTQATNYLPNGMRLSAGKTKTRFLTQFMNAVIYVSGNDRAVITFKSHWLVASDVWMTHWLYMYLSIFDAVANIRLTYVILQTATTLLIAKVTLQSVLFMFTGLTKVAWIMCLVQTLLRVLFKFIVRCLRAVRLIRSQTREKLDWNIDSISMFLSYRLYNVLLCLLTFGLLLGKGSPSYMVRATPFRVPVYGGIPTFTTVWRGEIVCDLLTLLGTLALIGQCLGVVLLYTKYKHVADNRVMRLLQKRYFISGWDGLMAADMLGLDPGSDNFLVENSAHTKCSIGVLVQLMYLSGSSGLVHLAGDYIFHDGGFSKDPIRFRFTVAQALAMGLFDTGTGSSVVSKYVMPASSDGTHAPSMAVSTNHKNGTVGGEEQPTTATVPVCTKTSIFSRRLRVVSEGYLGKILLVDATNTGSLVTNKETNAREYEVVDALSTMSILDIKWLLGSEKKLRFE